MISSLSETNRYALPVNPTAGQGTSFDAHAPEGYQGSTEGLAAGQRVQTGARAEAGGKHLPNRTRSPVDPGLRQPQPADKPPRAERRSLPPFAAEVNLQPDHEGHVDGQIEAQGPGSEHRHGASEGLAGGRDRSVDSPAVDSPAEEREVQQLRHRDAEVRAHEQAHAAAGGSHAGRPTYEFEQGPDGRRYAVAGEVQIDVAPVPDDPQATIEKMRTVRRAALAPAEPSPQDRRVAAEASRNEADARRELSAEQREERLTELADMSGSTGAVNDADNEGTPVRAQDVGTLSDTPLGDGFTAADVGQPPEALASATEEALASPTGAEQDAPPGALALSAVSRARGASAFDHDG